MADPIHVIVVAASLLVREGIKALLDRDESIGLIGEAPGADSHFLAGSPSPDAVALHADAPLLRVCEAISQLRLRWRDAGIVALYDAANEDEIARLMAAGARGHVSPREAERSLVAAVCATARGETWPRGLLAGNGIVNPDDTGAADPSLTVRERELLAMIGSGRSNVQIAAALGLANQTVRNITRQVYGKLYVHTRAEAVVWAREHGYMLEPAGRIGEADRPPS